MKEKQGKLMMQKKTNLLLSLFGLSSLALSFTACTRSVEYEKDQVYTKEAPLSYYDTHSLNQKTKPVTQRLELLGQPKKRAFIFSFWNDTPFRSPKSGWFAAEELKRNMSASQRVVLPTEIRSDLTTEEFLQGDQVKVAQLVREGRRMGVSVVVIGRISKFVFRQRGDEIGLFRQKQTLAAVELELKVFDVGGGREISALRRTGESSSNAFASYEDSKLQDQEFREELLQLCIRDAMAQVTPDVLRTIEKMSWEGRIAKIQGNRVYISAGRASGLLTGDILKVLTRGEEVYDPASGSYLGRTQGLLKGTVEVIDFMGQDSAVALLHTGANVQEGDLVQLY